MTIHYLKQLVKKYATNFTYFYQHLRFRMFIAMALSLSVGMLDGLGLAMFLPLLQLVSTTDQASAEAGLGNLDFILHALNFLGVGLTVTSVLCVMLFFFLMKGIARFIEAYFRMIMNQFFSRKIYFENIQRFTNFKYKAFVTTDVGRVQNTLGGEVGRVNQAYTAYFNTVQNAIMVAVYSFLAFLSNPQFALLVLIGGALSNLIYRRIYRKTKETSRNITRIGHGFAGLLVQKIAHFKYLKATGFIYGFADKIKLLILKMQEENRKIGFYNAVLTASREPIVVSVVVAVILVQVHFFAASLALIILSLLFFYRSLTFLMVLQNQWNSFMAVAGSMENMTSFVKELSAGKEVFGSLKVSSFHNSIELRDVSFSYGPTTVLHNVNLTIPRNQTTAFVGESGSGKTTLVNILSGLLKVDQGEMLIDGKNVNEIYTPSFQRRIGYITQEPVIFSDTVFNNVTFWAEDTPENRQRFWEALRKASIDDFVKSLPKQEQSLLGNNGILVSGGQKQRLSIARELYKDIDILIMDEATSALDSETERAIQENIDALKGKYTILIIAHRLATIKNADNIVVLSKGSILEAGDFYGLNKKSTVFKNMVALQEL